MFTYLPLNYRNFVIFFLHFIGFANSLIAEGIQIFGFGKNCRELPLTNKLCINEVLDKLHPSVDFLMMRDLHRFRYINKNVTLYRDGTFYIVDITPPENTPFQLKPGDILLFSRTYKYFDSIATIDFLKKTEQTTKSAYPACNPIIQIMSEYYLKNIGTKENELTREYYLFYKELPDLTSVKQYRFENNAQIDEYKANPHRNKTFDKILYAVLEAFPSIFNSYKVHLQSPHCARLVNIHTGEVYCYILHENKLYEPDIFLPTYYNIRLENSFDMSDSVDSPYFRAIISMSLFVNSNETITSITFDDKVINVTINSQYGEERYLLKENERPLYLLPEQ